MDASGVYWEPTPSWESVLHAPPVEQTIQITLDALIAEEEHTVPTARIARLVMII